MSPCMMPAHRRHAAALGLLLGLGACTAGASGGMSPEAYAALQHAIRTDPAARAAFTEQCTQGRAAEPQAAREKTAELLGVTPDRADRVFCERETVAIGMGYIRHADFVALSTGRGDAAAARRVIAALDLATKPRMTPEEFADTRDRLRDPAYRNGRDDVCRKELGQLWSAEERARWAADLGVEADRAVSVYCERLSEAIAAGRIAYEEWAALTSPGGNPDARARAIRVLREASSRRI